jgi:hypothetical protein
MMRRELCMTIAEMLALESLSMAATCAPRGYGGSSVTRFQHTDHVDLATVSGSLEAYDAGTTDAAGGARYVDAFI